MKYFDRDPFLLYEQRSCILGSSPVKVLADARRSNKCSFDIFLSISHETRSDIQMYLFFFCFYPSDKSICKFETCLRQFCNQRFRTEISWFCPRILRLSMTFNEEVSHLQFSVFSWDFCICCVQQDGE